MFSVFLGGIVIDARNNIIITALERWGQENQTYNKGVQIFPPMTNVVIIGFSIPEQKLLRWVEFLFWTWKKKRSIWRWESTQDLDNNSFSWEHARVPERDCVKGCFLIIAENIPLIHCLQSHLTSFLALVLSKFSPLSSLILSFD